LRAFFGAGNLYAVSRDKKPETPRPSRRDDTRPRTYMLPAGVRRIIDQRAIDLDASPSAALAEIVRAWKETRPQ